jgi:uncharacterized protein
MTNTPAVAATREQNPFTLVYRDALTKNEPGKINIHPVTYKLTYAAMGKLKPFFGRTL